MTQAAADTAATTSTNPRSLTMLQQVATQIGSIGPVVEDKVIGVLVQREVEKRSNALVAGFDVLDKLEKEGRRIKPDVVAYDEQGAVTSSQWSKTKLEERNNHNKKLAKVRSALERALTAGDYSKLYEVASGKPIKEEADDAGQAE